MRGTGSPWSWLSGRATAILCFDFRLHNFFSCVIVTALSCSVFFLSETPAGNYFVPFLASPEAKGLVASSDQRDLDDVSWTSAAPNAAFIDFDATTVNELRSDTLGIVSLKEEIAKVLDWLRSGPRPRAVFLDLSPLYDKSEKGDTALAGAIARWNADPRAAPMAVYAGPPCFEVGDKGYPSILDGGPYAKAMANRTDGNTAPGHRIIWSCPMYDGLDVAFWSCAFAVAGEDLVETVALPSPGWFALAVREADVEFAKWMAPDLTAASKACKNGARSDRATFPGANGAAVPKYSRTRFTFDPRDETRHQVDGNTIIDIIPATRILSGTEINRNQTSDRLVVIGSSDSSQGFSDMLNTSAGRVPGSLIVATDMRNAWIAGFPRTKSWLQDTAIVLLTCIVAYVAMIAARMRRMKLTARKHSHILEVMLVNSGLVGLACTSLCLFLSLALATSISGSDIVRVAVSIIAIELLFTIGSISEDANAQAG